MNITTRCYDNKRDFQPVKDFLASTFNLDGPDFQHWVPLVFENVIFTDTNPGSRIQIWERINGSDGKSNREIVSLVILDPPIFTIHSRSEFKFLEADMIAWAEEHLVESLTDARKEKRIITYALSGDSKRIELLEGLGYHDDGLHNYPLVWPVNKPVVEHDPPEGFTVRSIREEDYQGYLEAIKLVFNHDRFTAEVFRLMRETTVFYVPELHLVAKAPDGKVAAFCMLRVDPRSKMAYFEPVGTVSDFRKQGLAKALVSKALVRVRDYNPEVIYLQSSREGIKLYESVGFTDKKQLYSWSKIL